MLDNTRFRMLKSELTPVEDVWQQLNWKATENILLHWSSLRISHTTPIVYRLWNIGRCLDMEPYLLYNTHCCLKRSQILIRYLKPHPKQKQPLMLKVHGNPLYEKCWKLMDDQRHRAIVWPHSDFFSLNRESLSLCPSVRHVLHWKKDLPFLSKVPTKLLQNWTHLPFGHMACAQ